MWKPIVTKNCWTLTYNPVAAMARQYIATRGKERKTASSFYAICFLIGA